MADGELLDLVCGPAGPLPETHQRYRLVQHLGSGGQAEVYRAVRVCSGVSSAPMTVKVFRVDPARPVADELRSWDKGDAALMDLNNRGVPGICRRADGFYGPPPHPPGQLPPPGDAVPIQVYDYLPGVNLREYVARRVAGDAGPGRRLNGPAALRTLARILRDLHNPADPAACPVLHMDVKPSNVMVLPNGEVRLIDFTGARYHRPDHITQIAYTAEAGGPEAFTGTVGPAYDVHGFGAVAYYLVTGAFPRAGAVGDSPDAPPPARSVLRRHPMLDSRPRLRDHLLAPLADSPADRPDTIALTDWVDTLAALARDAGGPDVGIDWSEAGNRVVGRAEVPRRPVAGTDTGSDARIERLERELVELRTVLGRPAVPTPQPAYAVPPVPLALRSAAGSPSAVTVPGMAVPGAPVPVAAGMPVSGTRLNGATAATLREPAASSTPPTRVEQPAGPATRPGPPAEGRGELRGRAAVPQRQAQPPTGEQRATPEPERRPRPVEPPGALRKGSQLTVAGVAFSFACWAIWAYPDGSAGLGTRFGEYLMVLAAAAVVFVGARLLGRLVIVQALRRPRRGAAWSHLAAAAFLAWVGVQYLDQAGWLQWILGWFRTMG